MRGCRGCPTLFPFQRPSAILYRCFLLLGGRSIPLERRRHVRELALDSPASRRLWGPNGIYSRYKTPEARRCLVDQLEQVIALEKFAGDFARAQGTVAMSCPQKDMNRKEFDMLVLPGPEEERILSDRGDSGRGTRREDSTGRTRLEVANRTGCATDAWRSRRRLEGCIAREFLTAALRLSDE